MRIFPFCLTLMIFLAACHKDSSKPAAAGSSQTPLGTMNINLTYPYPASPTFASVGGFDYPGYCNFFCDPAKAKPGSVTSCSDYFIGF